MKNKKLGELIKEYRELNNLSLRDFAEKIDVSHNYVSVLEKNYNPTTKKPPVLTIDILKNVASVIGIDFKKLINEVLSDETVINLKDNNINYNDVDYDIINEDDNFIRMPIIGSVPAGIPIEAIEDYDGELMVPMSHLKGSRSDYMLITVKGDSMYPKYLDGDIILVRKNPSPDSGKDCIVFVNDEDATLKTFYKDKKGITLKPINPMYKEMHFTPEEVNSNNIRVLGVAVSLEYRKL